MKELLLVHLKTNGNRAAVVLAIQNILGHAAHDFFRKLCRVVFSHAGEHTLDHDTRRAVRESVTLPTEPEEKLSDISAHGDTLLVLSRSYAYVSLPPYQNFQRIGFALNFARLRLCVYKARKTFRLLM